MLVCERPILRSRAKNNARVVVHAQIESLIKGENNVDERNPLMDSCEHHN